MHMTAILYVAVQTVCYYIDNLASFQPPFFHQKAIFHHMACGLF